MEELHDFGTALQHVKNGHAIQRRGWHGWGMAVRLQPPHDGDDAPITRAYLYLETQDGHRVPWVTSQSDVLAEDWRLL